MNVGIWGWDTPNEAWVQVLVDSLGHLQVDVLSTVMDTDAATEATLADIESAVDGLEAAQGQCYGWIGDVWYHLLVESAAHPNLRTRLYDGTNPIVSVGTAASIADTNRGLFTQAGIRGRDNSFWRAINAEDNPLDALSNDRVSLSGISKLYGFNGVTWSRLRVESDALFNLRVKLFDGATALATEELDSANWNMAGLIGQLLTARLALQRNPTDMRPWYTASSQGDNNIGLVMPPVVLYGFDGTYWDRLRTYGTGILKVGRAPIGATITRMTGTGPVGDAGAHDLYWVACSPDDPNAEWEITDAIAAGGTVVYDHFDNDKHSDHITFDPPMPFSTGIYVEKFDHQKSLVFCYI